MGRLWLLVVVFAPLSLVSVGGGMTVSAEMQRQAVDVHGWMTEREFADLFAISRAAPGPGSLVAALVGWHVAGVWGAVVAALALYVPSSLLLYGVGLWWHGGRGQAWRGVIERGLRPVAVGLIFAGSLRVMQANGAGWLQAGTVAAATGVLLRWGGPYWVLLGVAGVYAGLVVVGVGV